MTTPIGSSRPRSEISRVIAWYIECQAFVFRALSTNAISLQDDDLLKLLTCDLQVPKLHAEDAVDARVLGKELESLCKCGNEDVEDLRGSIKCSVPFFFDRENKELDLGRKLCHMQGGDYMDVGWFPESAREGDVLCIFDGSPYPFALRPREDGCYVLLGDCYTWFTTLRKGLGGSGWCDEESRNRWQHLWYNDWQSANREMRQLKRGMEWITLR